MVDSTCVLLLLTVLASLSGFCRPFSVPAVGRTKTLLEGLNPTTRFTASGLPCFAQTRSRTQLGASKADTATRRDVFGTLVVSSASAFIAAVSPRIASADVSDGTSLPQAAAQFSRVVRLKSDLKGVRDRVSSSGSDLDKKEWDNIGQFLRIAYSTGDDMKAVAAGVSNPDNKKRALEDVDQLRKYAQAGDIPVNKKDASGFVAIADKMIGLVNDFLDSLSDVPDEI